MKKIFKKLYIRYLIFARNFTKAISPNNINDTSTAKQCTTICRKLIHDRNSDLLIAPISGKKYIRNEKYGIFITMEAGDITITNHTYSYFIKLPENKWIKLKNAFKVEVEKRVMEVESELEIHIKQSLDNIFDKIKDF